MYYLRARYYDPYVKRFTSYDIIEGDISNPLDMNRYAYCRNNPVRYIDPSGKFAIAATTNTGVTILMGITYIAGLVMAADLGKKVGEVLKTRKGSIQNAPKPPGTPGWDTIRDLTMAEILRRAQKGETGFRTIWKLLNDGRFKK